MATPPDLLTTSEQLQVSKDNAHLRLTHDGS